MGCECADWCVRANSIWCKICHDFSKFKNDYALLRKIDQWQDEATKLEEAMTLTPDINWELRELLKTTERKVKMEYKTKEEMKSAIANMEAEIEKMKEALKQEEEKEKLDIWTPEKYETFYSICGDFDVSSYVNCCDIFTERRTNTFNCFKTLKEVKDAAADLKTMFMLYRLSKESMKKSDIDCYSIDDAGTILKYRLNEALYTPFIFSSKEDAKKALELVGEENYLNLFDN